MTIDHLFYLLALSVITSLICWGVHSVTRPGSIFAFIDAGYTALTAKLAGAPLLMRFVYQLARPLFRCPECMASCWSIVVWLLLVGPLRWHLLLVMLMTCGLNTVVSFFIDEHAQPDTID